MAAETQETDLEALIALLSATEQADERLRALREAARTHAPWDLAERLKEEADRARPQDIPRSFRWSGDIIALGKATGAPTAVALGYMAEAFTLYWQGNNRASLERFDEASALFLAHGDKVGWARTQIGRTATCMALGRFEEALERAAEARAIYERTGETLRVASIDTNLALLLERMNRPAEALAYSERALAAYRGSGQTYFATTTLTNHALLLWRLGHVREALQAQREARHGYVALGALTEAAREDLNMGAAYLSLGHYAEALRLLTNARDNLLTAKLHSLAATAGLYLAECFVRLGRFHEAVKLTATLDDEFGRSEVLVERVKNLVWRGLAQTGLHKYEAALRTLDRAADRLAGREDLATHRAALAVSRAQLLLQSDRMEEAQALLQEAIPALSEAGLAIDAAAAQVHWGETFLEGSPAEAQAAAEAALWVAEQEGLDWLAARALHLRGRVRMQQGDKEGARKALSAAVRHLDRVHRRVAWDDRVGFAGTSVAVYLDTVRLAVQQGRAAAALRYAERAKAGALADHLRARIDLRPRVRDEHTRSLIDEMERLRERYGWLGAPQREQEDRTVALPALRWATEQSHDEDLRVEMAHIEQRLAEIWRELQVSNPAYRGEAAALDLADVQDETSDDDEAADLWVGNIQEALGSHDTVALLEYVALGDDLLLFVLRSGSVHAVWLAGAGVEVRRLVPLLRLNVERHAAALTATGTTPRALALNVRGLLQRLHATLLTPAAPLLDGTTQLVIVPHGAAHHVPFHALHNGHHYLIERMEVSYAPCAGLIRHFTERQHLLRATEARQTHKALVLACSDGGVLPHVGAEGRAVVATLGGLLLHDDQATLAALRARAGDCGVLHVAAHAVFRPDEPLFSSLHLGDGRLSAMDVFNLELQCSLVTLSACETALGMAGAGDELMGLSRAFLYAGAPSLLLSLWKVEDRSTATLMRVFYQALRQGATKAAALRQAQLALLHNMVETNRDLSAPFFWAPFTLIGHAGAFMGV